MEAANPGLFPLYYPKEIGKSKKTRKRMVHQIQAGPEVGMR